MRVKFIPTRAKGKLCCDLVDSLYTGGERYFLKMYNAVREIKSDD